VLSTVAHEWVHNYLTLFPLGLNYAASPELTILNETVADIAGDELGAAALRAAYPALVREFPGKDEPAASAITSGEPLFDFQREMRHTRAIVDQFLAAGRVEDAEEYMQIRRLLFQENGYPIRKLNQAYFAFHGSYGGSPAASSPIGPKLQQLRAALVERPLPSSNAPHCAILKLRQVIKHIFHRSTRQGALFYAVSHLERRRARTAARCLARSN
jgi:hypothetical protein